MSLMSKTKTVTHSVIKDAPTARVPIRTNYHSWKMKRDSLNPSFQSSSCEGIEKSVADLFSDLKKSHNRYSLHQSSDIPCSVQRSSYSSVTTTKNISGSPNPIQNVAALSDTSTQKALQNIDNATTSPITIASNLNPIKNKVTLSKTSTLKSIKNIDNATKSPTNVASNLIPVKSKVKSKVKFIDRPSQKILHNNNNIVTARPAIRDSPIVMNTSSTTSKITSSSHKVIINKSLDMEEEEFSPHFQRRSILDEMNILKTPVNDSLTRKTILTNVVPVTSLITESNIISDEPTARKSLDSVLSKLDDSITLVEESQTFHSKVVRNISDACTYKGTIESSINPLIDSNLVGNTYTSLTPEKGSESPVSSKEDELSKNMENITPNIFSRQDTESFFTPAEYFDRAYIVENKEENSKAVTGLTASEELDESITSIPEEIDLTVEDIPIEKTISNDTNNDSIITTNTIIQTRNELKNTSSTTKRKLYRDDETSEKVFPTSGIIIDLPPLISPMNSDSTKVSEDVSYMTPDSTTELTVKTPRSINKPTNKQKKSSLRTKVQNRQISVKRKLRDVSSPRCHCDNENEKESKKRCVGRPKKSETIKIRKTRSKSGTPRRKKPSPESDIEYGYDSENLSCPKTRNMMRNPRTKTLRDPLLLTMD